MSNPIQEPDSGIDSEPEKSDPQKAADTFIQRGREAQEAGEFRQALIHYEDALYYLRSDPALENYLEKLRGQVGTEMREKYENLIVLENELKQAKNRTDDSSRKK